MALMSRVLVVVFACCLAIPAAAGAKPYDFDGDGRQELVAGLPQLAHGAVLQVGAVVVVEGTPTGLDVAGRRLISQSRDGLPDGSEHWDEFGRSLASGDFDADGYADLAIGSTESEDVFLGAVTVMYGSAAGLTSVGATQFEGTPQIDVEWEESYTASHLFGASLAAGDLNGDGADDLVVGATAEAPRPESDYGSGAVHLLFGGPGGLARDGERTLTRPRLADEAFGAELALGDIDRDGHLDLVEGAAGNGFGLDNEDVAGHVSYCPGGPAGPTSCRVLGRRSRHNTGRNRRGREGPASLAIGDVTGDGYPDIVEGVPEDRWWSDSSAAPSGAVLIRRGTASGPSERLLRIDQATPGVPGRPDKRDYFGTAVAVGRLDGDRYADIVVSAIWENVHVARKEAASLGGRVTVLRGGPAGVLRRGAVSFDGRTPALPRTGLGFGAALTLLDHDGNGRLDLTVGSHGWYNNGAPTRGTLVTVLGGRRGFSARRALGMDWTTLGLSRRTGSGFGSVVGR